MEYATFDLDNIDDIKSQLDQNCNTSSRGPMSDTDSDSSRVSHGKKRHRREQDYIVRDFMTALALYHNLTPTYADENEKSLVEF
jgi:hypothetical protein